MTETRCEPSQKEKSPDGVELLTSPWPKPQPPSHTLVILSTLSLRSNCIPLKNGRVVKLWLLFKIVTPPFLKYLHLCPFTKILRSFQQYFYFSRCSGAPRYDFSPFHNSTRISTEFTSLKITKNLPRNILLIRYILYIYNCIVHVVQSRIYFF